MASHFMCWQYDALASDTAPYCAGFIKVNLCSGIYYVNLLMSRSFQDQNAFASLGNGRLCKDLTDLLAIALIGSRFKSEV